MADTIRIFLERYKVDPSLIAFVISEENAYLGVDNLDYMIKVFKNLGIKLYIGNYTSGYMDVRYNYFYGFDGVILNVRNILEGSGQESGEIVLSTRANMLKELGKEVIYAKVDSMYNYDVVRELDGKYIYGEFLSPSFSKNELQNRFWHGERFVVTHGEVKHLEEE